MKTFTKDELINKLIKLTKMGWVANGRFGNHGGIGNTLEDYLEIEENNLPIPNAAEWELKTQRLNTSSLTTLFHTEPSPRAVGFVPKVLLPKYGWSHQKAGKKYPKNEMSFRQTIHGQSRSDRGFMVVIDRKEYYKYTKVMMLQNFSFEGFIKALEEGKILIDFDARSGHNHGTKFRC